jgi:heme A synthase
VIADCGLQILDCHSNQQSEICNRKSGDPMTALTAFTRPLAKAIARRDVQYATLSLAAFLSVLVLMTVGSIVRVTGNGLGCPDWPLCYGQVVPPFYASAWVEFSHRLMGAVASAQIVGLAVWAWGEHRREKWIVVPATAALGFLAAQIVVGGLHVIFELPPQTGWIHTATAMAIAALVAMLVAASHPSARALSARAAAVVARDRGLPVAIATTAFATYLLILTGSYVTRTGASLACPAFPHCGAETTAIAFPELVNIQMLHRFTAFGVALTACFTLWRLIRAARREPGFRAVVFALTLLIAVQFGLGIGNVLLRLPMWSRSLHLLDAAMLWAGLAMLWVVVQRGAAAERTAAA